VSAAAVARTPSPAPRSPHAALLLACARLALSPEEASRVRRMVAAGVDWPTLLELARRHRLIPLLHRHLREAPLPAAAASELRGLNRDAAHHALLMAGELRRLLAALETAGVEALAYKGPTLAVQAYGDLSLRPFIDLDLLVRPADVPRALGALEAEGYAPVLRLSPAQERAFRRVDGDYQLVHRVTGTLVELHARVSTTRFAMPLETEALLRRAQSVRVGGGEVRTLGDQDLLVVLCAHGAKHRWKRLEWLVALSELLRAGRGDVEGALLLAATAHARRTFLLGLALARRILGAPVPDAIAREIDADADLARLAAEVEARLLAEDAEEGDETVANLRFNLRARDGLADRARSAARWFFAPGPEDWRWVHLPDALFPLYRLLRPVRLLLRHGGRGGGR
jgi:hypothetical protein